MSGAAVVTGAPPPPRWAPRALGTWRRADPRRTSRGTVDVASRRVAFPSAALVDARRARRDRDARVAARSAGGGASSRDSPTTTSDADACVFERGDVALLPNGARMRFVSRPDVQFLYDEIFVDECYAKHGLEIREGATVIDVGGNIGMFALYAARKAGTSGRVFAMEPIPKTFAALRENVTNNVEGFFSSSSSSSPTSRGADDDVRRVACLDAKEAAAALRARNPSRARKKTNDEGSTPNVVAYNVGVSDGLSNAATFTFYPRAAGWSSLAPDDAETRDNVSRFARRRLSLRGDGDGDGDASGDSASKANASTAALHPLASLGAKLLAFADGGDDDDDDASTTRTKNALNVADALRRGFVRVARAVARLAFSLAVSLVTAYLLGGKITRECPLVTVSDVIRANGLRVEYPSRDEKKKEGLSSVSTDDDSRHYAVDFLKIDVERGELAALRGIDEEHRGSIKQIAMEVHDGDGDGLQTVLDLLTAPTRVDERVGSGAGGFGFDKARVVAEQPDELLGGTLWNVYARR